ncbi:uncharacterized protein RJT21DRAFT_35366 [Scheffersomyces amazonensis]|uniref:uncharacterized protein n=1 Tax=Scheffersomyces amazonensis TaxID=1078765 RepID=UPI00315D7E39
MIDFYDLPHDIILQIFELASASTVYDKFIDNFKFNSFQLIALEFVISKRLVISKSIPKRVGYDAAKIMYSLAEFDDSFLVIGLKRGIEVLKKLMIISEELNKAQIPKEIVLLINLINESDSDWLTKLLDIFVFERYYRDPECRYSLQIINESDIFITKNSHCYELMNDLRGRINKLQFQTGRTSLMKGKSRHLWNLTSSPTLEELYLPRCSLIDSITRNIFKSLPRTLKVIDLTANDITHLNGFIMPPFLEKFIIRTNQLLSLKGPNYSISPVFHTLDASVNSIKQLEDIIEFGSSLKIFRISYNNIKTLNQKQIPPQVEILNLSDNLIKEINFILPSSLKQLYLGNNSLKSLPDNFFLNSTNLKVLDISDNNFDDLDDLGTLPSSLKELVLDNNQIDYFEITNAFTTNLIKLSMMSTGLVALRNINMSPKLKQLNLSENEISDIRRVHFGYELCELNLSSNKLITFGLPAQDCIYPSTLRSLNLSYNPIVGGLDCIKLPMELSSLSLSGIPLDIIDNNLIKRFPNTLNHLELNNTCFTNSKPRPNNIILDVNFEKYLPILNKLFLDSNNIISINNVTYPDCLQTLSYKFNYISIFPYDLIPSAVTDLRVSYDG